MSKELKSLFMVLSVESGKCVLMDFYFHVTFPKQTWIPLVKVLPSCSCSFFVVVVFIIRMMTWCFNLMCTQEGERGRVLLVLNLLILRKKEKIIYFCVKSIWFLFFEGRSHLWEKKFYGYDVHVVNEVSERKREREDETIKNLEF